MAAYAATITAALERAHKIDTVIGIFMYPGRCDLTNYNTTLAEITAITKKFQNLDQVICPGVSSNGYLVAWDATGKAFKAWYFDYDNVADGPAIEAPVDTDIGEFDFIAIGRN